VSTNFAPMLATLGSVRDIDDEDDWAFEMKWDGIRAIATVTDGNSDKAAVRLTSRNGHDMTSTYPDLLPSLKADTHARSATLDGEIVALDETGRPDFGLLQRRINLANSAEIERMARNTPVHYMIFDIVELDGESLVRQEYDERRKHLEKTVVPAKEDRVHVPPAFHGGLTEAIASSKQLGLEGVVAKHRDGRYAVGRRSPSWIKIKHHRTQEVVVGGWRPGKGRRSGGIGSLLVGIPEGDGVRYVGRVGTGFTDSVLDDIARRLKPLARQEPTLAEVPRADASDAKWVATDLVGEVEFAEWTNSGHLRQPSWRGWRPDKSPKDVRPE
jgi:bifunctional non-homologous end joining protein LigD